MRRALGVVLVLTGVVVCLGGTAVAVALGPDCRATTGPHPVATTGVALVTRPEVISWAGARVTVLAEVPDKKPVFVGLANAVDVANYLRGTARLEVGSYRAPWHVTTEPVAGADRLAASPTALDWWLAEGAGLGGAAVTVRLPDDPVSLAVLAVGDTDLRGLRLTTSYDLPGGFGVALGVAAVGLGLATLGWLLARLRPLVLGADDDWADDDEWDDEVVDNAEADGAQAADGGAGGDGVVEPATAPGRGLLRRRR